MHSTKQKSRNSNSLFSCTTHAVKNIRKHLENPFVAVLNCFLKRNIQVFGRILNCFQKKISDKFWQHFSSYFVSQSPFCLVSSSSSSSSNTTCKGLNIKLNHFISLSSLRMRMYIKEAKQTHGIPI